MSKGTTFWRKNSIFSKNNLAGMIFLYTFASEITRKVNNKPNNRL